MAACKKNATRLGAHIIFVDESGFLLIPTVRRSWAPRGETPICRHSYRHDRISAISGISVSPVRHRLDLFYELHLGNIRQAEVCVFLRHMLRHLRGHVIVVWDGGSIHRGELIRTFCRKVRRLHLERFPAYAPELNPDEGVWAHMKRELANGCAGSVHDLGSAVIDSIDTIRRSRKLLRGCIAHTGLPLF
jgi:transposase